MISAEYHMIRAVCYNPKTDILQIYLRPVFADFRPDNDLAKAATHINLAHHASYQ